MRAFLRTNKTSGKNEYQFFGTCLHLTNTLNRLIIGIIIWRKKKHYMKLNLSCIIKTMVSEWKIQMKKIKK